MPRPFDKTSRPNLNGAFEPMCVSSIKTDVRRIVSARLDCTAFVLYFKDTPIGMFDTYMFMILMESSDDAYNQLVDEYNVTGLPLKWGALFHEGQV